MHDPGEILLDVALAVALGGADGLADVGILQAESVVFWAGRLGLDGLLAYRHPRLGH